jgi:hypothetical protein
MVLANIYKNPRRIEKEVPIAARSHVNEKSEIDIGARIENSLFRIDHKFDQLNRNL